MKGTKNMEINKQLFEDVLSGKLKGTFVLRNGDKVKSSRLSIDTNADANYPISLNGYWYTNQGEFNLTRRCNIDIIDFIPDTDMKENELTIEIPDNKVVDWDESKKQNKIVLKDKQLTYEDVCKKLFEKRMYFIDKCGTICLYGPANVTDPNNAPTEHQLDCILAKNKLANVATFLNDGWKPSKCSNFYAIGKNCELENLEIQSWPNTRSVNTYGEIWFKSEELAQQAIEILGEETIKLAVEPLGV